MHFVVQYSAYVHTGDTLVVRKVQKLCTYVLDRTVTANIFHGTREESTYIVGTVGTRKNANNVSTCVLTIPEQSVRR